MPRFLRARDQYEMTLPWRTAAPGDITPGAGLPMAPNVTMPGGVGLAPSGPTPVVPRQAEPKVPEGDWVNHPGWRDATDGLAFHSSVRPPMLSDIPHPSDVLDPTNADHTTPRVYRITDPKTKAVTEYHYKSWLQQAKESADPVNDPWGVQTPPHRVIHFANGIPKGPDGKTLTTRRGIPVDQDKRWRSRNGADVTDQGWQPHATPHDLVANRVGHEMSATPEQHEKRAWYRGAHEETDNLAQKTYGDQERVVHTVSVFSPKTEWDENMEKAYHFVLNYRPDGIGPGEGQSFDPVIPGMQSPVRKAKEIYHLPDGEFQKVNQGPKTASFAHNIIDKTPPREPRPGVPDDFGFYQLAINPFTREPDWRLHSDQNTTVDTHDVRMAHTPPQQPNESRDDYMGRLRKLRYATPIQFGTSLTLKPPKQAADESHQDYFDRLTRMGFSPTMKDNGKVQPGKGRVLYPGYEMMARSNWEARRQLNAMESDPLRHRVPKQGQSVTWTKFKDDLDEAKNKHMPQPGEPLKSFPEDPTEEAVEKWMDSHPLNNPIPRYRRDLRNDQGDPYWIDPRRPDVGDMRKLPGWGYTPSHMAALGEVLDFADTLLHTAGPKNPYYRGWTGPKKMNFKPKDDSGRMDDDQIMERGRTKEIYQLLRTDPGFAHRYRQYLDTLGRPAPEDFHYDDLDDMGLAKQSALLAAYVDRLLGEG